MKNWQKFIIGLTGMIIAIGVIAAPASNIFRNIQPEATNTYGLGTTTARWLEFFGGRASTSAVSITNSLYIGGTASTTGTATSTLVGANATSTFSGGIRLVGGCFELANGTCITGGGITSLNGLTGATQTFTDDTNVTIVSGGTAHVITWSGTLADSRVADNITLTNITQITNRAISDTTGTLTVSRGGTGITTFGGTNQLLYTSTADNLTSSANLIFNGTNFGIGTTTPGSILSVQGAANFRTGTSTIYSGLDIPVFNATSTTASSTTQGGLKVGNTLTASSIEATSTIRIPVGITTTASTSGMFGIDTSDDQFFYNTGTSTPATSTTRVLSPFREFSFSIASSTSFTTSDGDLEKLLLRRFRDNVTIREIFCITDAGTQVIGLYQTTQVGGITSFAVNGIGQTITCDSDGARDDGTIGNGSVPAGAWLALNWSTAATSPKKLNVTIYYTTDRH